MKFKNNIEQGEIFVFIASFFLIALGFNEPEKIPPKPEKEKIDEPPIILLRESSKFKFISGSAELNKEFKDYIYSDLAQEIVRIASDYDIDVIEIIGHTDGQPVGIVEGNLDLFLEKANLDKSFQMSKLEAASNTDLGMMRALSVAKEIKEASKESKKLNIRAYSAGQLILEDGSPASPDKSENSGRRRIEIRFTKLGDTRDAK